MIDSRETLKKEKKGMEDLKRLSLSEMMQLTHDLEDFEEHMDMMKWLLDDEDLQTFTKVKKEE